MKKIVSSLICLVMVSTLCSCSSSVANNKSRVTNEMIVASSNKTITKDVSFTVMDLQSKPIQDAKIVIISANGDVISVESSDKSGKVQKKVTVAMDKKYYWKDPSKMEPRG